MANAGPAQLRALGVRLKALSAEGDMTASTDLGLTFGRGKTLRAQLLYGIRVGVQPAVKAVQEEARNTLPRRGGLNAYVAGEKIKVTTRVTGKSVGVRVVPASGHWGGDQATVRHPVFGKWRAGVKSQPLSRPGWFTGTMRREAPRAAIPVRAAMEAVAAEVTLRGF